MLVLLTYFGTVGTPTKGAEVNITKPSRPKEIFGSLHKNETIRLEKRGGCG